MKKISIINELGYLKTIEEGQRIIVKSPLQTDFSKSKGRGPKKERIAYIYCMSSPNNIIINMLSTKDKRKSNQSIFRTNSNKPQISIREFYFIKIDASSILNAKNDILDQQEMNQFKNIVNSYSVQKRKLIN